MMVSETTGSIVVWCAMVRFQLRVPIFIRTFLRPLSPDPIFIRISEVTFCKKIPKFIQTCHEGSWCTFRGPAIQQKVDRASQKVDRVNQKVDRLYKKLDRLNKELDRVNKNLTV